MKTITTKPYLYDVTLDKLVLVRYIPASDAVRVRQKLRKMRKDGNANKWGKKPFGMGFTIPLLNSPANHWVFHIQEVNHGKYADHSRLWISFNPGILDDPSLQHVIQQLEGIIGMGYPRFISAARVTRVDFAFDFLNLTIDEFCFYKLRYKHWDVHIHNDRIQSIRFGSSNSRNKIRIYDKTAQMKQVNCTVLPVQIHRVEFQFGPDISLSKVPSLLQKIQDLHVYDLRSVASTRPQLYYFGDSCRLRTVGGAIQKLDSATAQHVRRLLPRYDINLFSDKKRISDLFWAHLKHIDRLKPPTLSPQDDKGRKSTM